MINIENNFKLREKILDLMENISMGNRTEIEKKQDEAFYKIVKIISSCQTSEQLRSATRMVENFGEVFKRKQKPKRRLDLAPAMRLRDDCDMLESRLLRKERELRKRT